MPVTRDAGPGVPTRTSLDAAQAANPRSVLVDVALLAAVFGVFFGAVLVARELGSPLDKGDASLLDLDPARLPLYTVYTLARGVVAYVFSFVFTVGYAKAATASPRAERFMIPILDILQSIPVLSFMPGLVLGLIALFPHSNFGLELACVLAIFTSQVWNMTFSFHASLKGIPAEVLEVGRINGFRPLKRLFSIELPSSMNGLVWNSMMSMAGGWFFITIIEAFTLGGRTFVLPGLGSYMAQAVKAGDGGAMGWAVLAMIVMIVAVDQLIWRPIIVWAERFRNEDIASSGHARSWFFDLLRNSPLTRWIRARASRASRDARILPVAVQQVPPEAGVAGERPRPGARIGLRVVSIAAALGFAALCAYGAVRLVLLLAPLGAGAWGSLAIDLLWTALRVLGALLIGAAWTIPVGFLIGRSQRLSAILLPVIQVLASFPAPMLYPFVVPLLFRGGFAPTIVATLLMMLGTQWYVLFNVAAGTAAAPNDLREVTSIFRTPRLRSFFLVDFASIFPFLITGLLTAAGGAWNASIVSEIVEYRGGQMRVDGIGALIAENFQSDDPGAMGTLAASTMCVAAALVLINRLVWKPLQRLAQTRFALNR